MSASDLPPHGDLAAHRVEVRRLALSDVNATVALRISHLLRQLHGEMASVEEKRLRQIVSTDNARIYVAGSDTSLVGMLYAVLYVLPLQNRMIVEDVIVDDSVRGQGLGRDLMRAALDWASEAGASTVDLTSGPSRVAANEMYKALGFVTRETNVYRFIVSSNG